MRENVRTREHGCGGGGGACSHQSLAWDLRKDYWKAALEQMSDECLLTCFLNTHAHILPEFSTVPKFDDSFRKGNIIS